MAGVEHWNEDFSRMGVDPEQAFNPILNVENSKSILLDGSDVGRRMIEEIAFPRDLHVMYYLEETTTEFAKRLCDSLPPVSHLT